MKLTLIFLLALVFFSCDKPNPLDPHVGVWAVMHGTPNQINTTDFFYLVVTQEQIDSKNITLVGKTLVIEKAELCCPFISGRHEFGVLVWNDSLMIACPQIRLPLLHHTIPYDRNSIVEMKRCKSHEKIKADAVGIMSFSMDSVNPINYLIDIEQNGIAYMQYFNKARFSDQLVLNSNLKKRELTKSEMRTFNELLKYHQVDTIYNPYNRNGCRNGRYFVDQGFRFQGKYYPFDHYNQSNSNMAIQGFLFTIAQTGDWKFVKGRWTFCAELKHYWDRNPKVKSIAFIPPVK